MLTLGNPQISAAGTKKATIINHLTVWDNIFVHVRSSFASGTPYRLRSISTFSVFKICKTTSLTIEAMMIPTKIIVKPITNLGTKLTISIKALFKEVRSVFPTSLLILIFPSSLPAIEALREPSTNSSEKANGKLRRVLLYFEPYLVYFLLVLLSREREPCYNKVR